MKLSFLPTSSPAFMESPQREIRPDNIPTKILKEFKTELSEPLSDMINVSFNEGTIPDFLEVANVIPVHKKGEKLDSDNYEIIFLLSSISKLYEKAMHIRLTNFLRKNIVVFPTNLVFEIIIQLIVLL